MKIFTGKKVNATITESYNFSIEDNRQNPVKPQPKFVYITLTKPKHPELCKKYRQLLVIATDEMWGGKLTEEKTRGNIGTGDSRK